ncbi:MAG: hemolysin [Gammaproteobacteria bacterium]|nr:hemolysin [Gammaproteobacteria bacterium]|tara:strand:+ start:1481 stop:2494 length:1014 start_codon:yes stop_codon:yes gene_type:complete
MSLLIAFAAASIGFSFLCSVLEAALLSVTPSYVASLRGKAPKLAERLRALKENIDDPLAAILTLNTIAHTGGATGVGAEVAVLFGEAWLGAASGAMTLAILVFSEIIPKTIGAKYWRNIAPYLPSVLGVMMTLLRPFVWLSQKITRRIGAGEEADMREEISALVEIGVEQRALDEDERRIIQNTLRFHQIKVSEIMTPRAVSKFLTPETTVGEFKARFLNMPFSRYPLIDDEGAPIGYVHRSDLLDLADGTTMRECARRAFTVKDTTNIDFVFGEMLRERQHLALIYDDLGTWVGLATMEDILETIIGQDIMDETDNVSNMRRYAKQRWSRRLKRMS